MDAWEIAVYSGEFAGRVLKYILSLCFSLVGEVCKYQLLDSKFLEFILLASSHIAFNRNASQRDMSVPSKLPKCDRDVEYDSAFIEDKY